MSKTFASSVQSTRIPAATPVRSTSSASQVLFMSGIASSLLYAAMNVFIPMQWPEYSVAGQTVSELSAIGAPTRTLWVVLGTIYTLLYAAFGWGIWTSAGHNHRLRIVGQLIVAHGVLGLFWPPMHLRGNPFSLTDALHIAFAMVTLVLMALTIVFAARAFGKAFRLYSSATLAVFVVFGALTGFDSPGIGRNLPTPWIGVWERINIGAFILWVIVLASAMLQRRNAAPPLEREDA